MGKDYACPFCLGNYRLDLVGSGTANFDAWDRFGRVLRQQWKRNSPTVDRIDYTYDYIGNRLSRDISSGVYTNDDRDQKYTYDGLLRLAQANSGTLNGSGNITDANADFRQKWTLDQLGNWTDFQQDGEFDYSNTANNNFTNDYDLDQDRTHNDVNELTAFSEGASQTVWVDPAFDAAGNMTTSPQPQAPSSSYTLTYDAWNRLVEVEDSVGTVQTNEYDGLNRRIERDETGGSGDHRHFYYNTEWQVLEERVGTPTTADMEYVYHPFYVDAVALRYDSNDVEHTYLYDANYNVTAVCLSSGVVERYDYTAYGEVMVLDDDYSLDADGDSDIGNEYLYTGRRLDPETELQINRNRFYHQQLGSWVTRDPIEYLDGINLYQYVQSSPLMHTDPSGKWAFVIPIITGGRGLSNLGLACQNLVNCQNCLSEAGKLRRRAQETLGPEAYKRWKDAAKPGSECMEICTAAGTRGLRAFVWFYGGVYIKGITPMR